MRASSIVRFRLFFLFNYAVNGFDSRHFVPSANELKIRNAGAFSTHHELVHSGDDERHVTVSGELHTCLKTGTNITYYISRSLKLAHEIMG